MKKEYVKPEVEIIVLNIADSIADEGDIGITMSGFEGVGAE